jgi:16S rRNA (cytosine1402-N4)-methyltransferase
MLDEAIAALALEASGCYVDGTFGRGGHARRILDALGPDGRLLAFDKDPEAVASARASLGADARFSIEHGSFTGLAAVCAARGWTGRVNGLLLDLGVSSPQLDEAGRGFSFSSDGPLDMRMDTTRGQTAAEWLAIADEGQIAEVLRDYGEERFARRIARGIVERRAHETLRSTAQLADWVARACPTRERHKHPATRTFQAIRIFINGELADLAAALGSALDVMARGARLVVISFHSLEDRIVKRFLRDASKGPEMPKGLPVRHAERQGRLRLVGGAVKPSAAEIERNPRARSAVMRVAEVLA